MPFVKIDTGILDSSIWCESTDTRLCWICLLVMADSNGLVSSTAPGISHRAGLSLDATRRALEILESPDPDSKSPENEGRRIERVDGGYLILNYEKYRKRDYTNAERQKRHRDRERNGVTTVTGPLSNALRNTPFASASVSDSDSSLKSEGLPASRKDIETLADHILAVLKIPMSDKGQTEGLLKAFGLDYMLAAVGRMGVYFDTVKENHWTEYIIGKHWRNLYEKLEYFSSDENLKSKLDEMRASRSKENRVDCRTVSNSFADVEEIIHKQAGAENVQ